MKEEDQRQQNLQRLNRQPRKTHEQIREGRVRRARELFPL
jgi:hypothetical protein